VRVLHVVATADRRGAETFAGDLVRQLVGDVSQRTVVLHGGSASVRFECPTVQLDCRQGVPGVRIDPLTAWRLRRIVRQWRPDVLQAHGGEPLKYASVGAAGRRTPVVYRRIGGAPAWLKHGPRRSVYGYLMRRASRIVVVAEAVRRETVELFGVPTDRIRVIPNGIDPARVERTRDRSATRRSLGIPPSSPVVLSLGALTWEKDPLTHVEVGSRVLREIPDAVHLLVGAGPMQPEVQAEIGRRGLAGRMLALGSRSDIGDVLGAADLVLFASREDGMEGMPAAVIEAGMAGLPVVAYRVAGVPEVVEDGATGVLVPPGQPAALAERVVALLREDGLRLEMGRAARDWCRSRHDISFVARRYVHLYRELLEAP
jgi:glycosyltransferase involved in cell wall biosynthesis